MENNNELSFEEYKFIKNVAIEEANRIKDNMSPEEKYDVASKRALHLFKTLTNDKAYIYINNFMLIDPVHFVEVYKESNKNINLVAAKLNIVSKLVPTMYIEIKKYGKYISADYETIKKEEKIEAKTPNTKEELIELLLMENSELRSKNDNLEKTISLLKNALNDVLPIIQDAASIGEDKIKKDK